MGGERCANASCFGRPGRGTIDRIAAQHIDAAKDTAGRGPLAELRGHSFTNVGPRMAALLIVRITKWSAMFDYKLY